MTEERSEPEARRPDRHSGRYGSLAPRPLAQLGRKANLGRRGSRWARDREMETWEQQNKKEQSSASLAILMYAINLPDPSSPRLPP